ncbi:hypothetical protein PINS_up009511 [Pythium insidiosum]|nr:hypothetical protein PINS_up009511 [Pythium insidiosum]
MGHRIHQIIYDPEMEAIEVKRYLERGSQGERNEPKVYTYSLWVEKTKSFHPLQQKFYQYPMPEDNWNSLDHLLCGYHDEMTDYTKCRRIRFAIVPPIPVVSGSKADKEAYVSQRFMRFVDYLQSRIVSEDHEKIEIKVTEHDGIQGKSERFKRCGVNSYKVCCSSLATFSRLKSGDTRREWVMMQLEDTLDVQRNYHFDLRWLACSGIIVDDFIATLKRKAKQAGLELRRVPEYARISFLQIHPLVAPIYFPMPLALTHKSEAERSLMDALISRLGFVLDDERVADAVGIGYGLGLGQDERPLTASGYRCWASRLRNNAKGSPPQRSSASDSRAVESVCKRGYVQVMHRQAPVFLRLIHNGLVWIPSYDYDQLSNPDQVQALFTDIVQLVQTTASLHELATTCCGSEAA